MAKTKAASRKKPSKALQKTKKKVKPIPDGYHSLTPYLIIKNAAEAIEFYKKALNAKLIFKMESPSGKIGHAEIQMGNSRLMLADEFPEMGFKSPLAYGGTPMSLMLYTEDVDALGKQAVKAGMKVQREIKDQFYGDRSGVFVDPFGFVWNIATHKEELSPAELKKRAAVAFATECSTEAQAS